MTFTALHHWLHMGEVTEGGQVESMTQNDANDRLFVYGALLDAAERARLLGRPIEATPARLPGYARGQKRYYFVARVSGAVTDGAILEDLSARDFEILDRYEDVPALYTRESIEVIALDGNPIICWIYLPTEWARAK
ncbi:MAG: Gamma-glutamyl cyclotransferase, AIG2-like [Candidatus Binataceae bacterium]|nr:Gamma-glutamyl cyclotransferase, AIG2-like [Candidatus Binataceae bacterium]